MTQLDRWRRDFGATQQRRGHLLGLFSPAVYRAENLSENLRFGPEVRSGQDYSAGGGAAMHGCWSPRLTRRSDFSIRHGFRGSMRRGISSRAMHRPKRFPEAARAVTFAHAHVRGHGARLCAISRRCSLRKAETHLAVCSVESHSFACDPSSGGTSKIIVTDSKGSRRSRRSGSPMPARDMNLADHGHQPSAAERSSRQTRTSIGLITNSDTIESCGSTLQGRMLDGLLSEPRRTFVELLEFDGEDLRRRPLTAKRGSGANPAGRAPLTSASGCEQRPAI